MVNGFAKNIKDRIIVKAFLHVVAVNIIWIDKFNFKIKKEYIINLIYSLYSFAWSLFWKIKIIILELVIKILS